MASFGVGMIYLFLNLFAVRNWNNMILRVINLICLAAAFGLKGYFVVYAAIKRNRNLGMCYFYSEQNLFFIAEGSVEIVCLILTTYLMFSLAEMISVRNLSGKLELFKILKKTQW